MYRILIARSGVLYLDLFVRLKDYCAEAFLISSFHTGGKQNSLTDHGFERAPGFMCS